MSSIYHNYLNARGCDVPGACDTTGNGPGAGNGHLFEVGSPVDSSYRGGLGDLTFGLAWAPFVQASATTPSPPGCCASTTPRPPPPC